MLFGNVYNFYTNWATPVVHLSKQQKLNVQSKKNENENGTMSIPRGNSYCCRKSSAKGPRFKVSSKGVSPEIDILIQSPIEVLTEAGVA